MSEKTFSIIQVIITFITVGVVVAFYNTLDIVVLGGVVACCGVAYNLVAAIYNRKLNDKKFKSSIGLTIVCIVVAVFIFVSSRF
ncbi:MAG: hypothetical protein RR620_05335 [Clostridium sp.]